MGHGPIFSLCTRVGHHTLFLTFPDDQVSARKVQYPVVDLLFEGDPAQSLRYFTTRRTASLCGRRGTALCSVTTLSTKDISGRVMVR